MTDNNINTEPVTDKIYALLKLFKELPEHLQNQLLKEIISAVQESESMSQ